MCYHDEGSFSLPSELRVGRSVGREMLDWSGVTQAGTKGGVCDERMAIWRVLDEVCDEGAQLRTHVRLGAPKAVFC